MRVGVMSDPDSPATTIEEMQPAARQLHITLRRVDVRRREDMEPVLATLSRERAGAVVVSRDAVMARGTSFLLIMNVSMGGHFRRTDREDSSILAAAGREPLDAAPVWADPPAHRATHVASRSSSHSLRGPSARSGRGQSRRECL